MVIQVTTSPKPARKKAKKVETTANYVCEFCEKEFIRESAFLEHVCVPMQRHHKMKTAEGVSAWMAYCTWVKARGQRVPPQSGFLSSHYYQSFIKFAEFVKLMKTIQVEPYIYDMVSQGLSPVIWTNDEVYQQWLRKTTAEKSPTKLAQQTASFLMDYAEDNNVELSKVFTEITAPLFAEWLDMGKISLWFMFGSNVFKQWFQDLEEEERAFLCTKFSVPEWITKLKNNPTTMVKIKAIVAEMGL